MRSESYLQSEYAKNVALGFEPRRFLRLPIVLPLGHFYIFLGPAATFFRNPIQRRILC